MPDTVTPPADPAHAWRDVLVKNPTDPFALAGLGRVMLRLRRPAQAVPILLAAVDNGAEGEALTDLAGALIESGQGDEAEPFLRRALENKPDNYPVLFALGRVLLDRGAVDDALGILRKARDIAPDPADAENTVVAALIARGNSLQEAGAFRDAERCFDEAIGYGQQLVTCHTNLGNALMYQARLPEALAAFETALRMDPGNDVTSMAYGMCLLLAGDDAGWNRYEARRRVAPVRQDHERRPDLPSWQPGMDLTGRRVLIMAEQGLGDLIQFVRLAPALARTAASAVLEMPWNLAPVMRGLPGIDRIIPLEEPAHGCDIACPLLSLPLLLGPNAGLTPPYLTIPEERIPRWQTWLRRSKPGRRIGLVCSGDIRHRHDALRSIPLAALTPLLDVPDTAFVLLQTEIRDNDRAAFDSAEDLRCPAAALTDYGDTAALIAGLDLVISVDTSVAHLAGALGRPVWTMLAYGPDYRWGLGRDDTRWYPTMRLFRQDRPGDWQSVIERVRAELANER